MKKQTMINKLSTVALVGGLGVSAQAAVIVEWGASGGDAGIVTANANGSKPTAYDGSTYISPADGTGTNGYDTTVVGQTREYYGAIGPVANVFGIVNIGGGDLIQMVYNSGTGGGSVDSMIAWGAADFLTSDRDLQTFTMEFSTRGGTSTACYLIETSTGWFQSDQILTNDDSTTTNSAIASLTWSSYTAFGVTAGTGTADTADILSVGAHFSSTATSGWTGARLQHFQVTADPVPEPTSALLLGLSGLALLQRRKR